MTEPAVVAVAITGSVPRKADNPTLPVTPAEQIESTHAAFEAGATLVHVHVRNADESSSSDPALFGQVLEGVRKTFPGMIVQFSTGGRGRDPSARGAALDLEPDMASLSTGSVNFPTIVYENPTRLVDRGPIDDRPHVQFVMGVQNAMPADEPSLDILIEQTRRLLPNATWTAAGIGRFQSVVMDWALARGDAAIRTGLEDNIRIDKARLANGNVELVRLAISALVRAGRHPATPTGARNLLGLKPVVIEGADR